ncbi:hypothetical protein BBO99_00009650 [Phytophthora kernoviae]|uniref:Uncharacterized protein n=1 Tax=Phytophthora kernoviae TaxID=325452 RepID=A0A421GCB5_9STRA|nr:hypothetical protein BBI17_009686 [Phytophthora kernoviae]RLN72888.1 hypothetical protein BBO99_00009650 [Phytophthora kernoviae]
MPIFTSSSAEGLELEHSPGDEATEDTVESEIEMTSLDKNKLEVSLREAEVTAAGDDDESEEVDSAESEPVASDVEDDSVVSGDDHVEVALSEERVGTEEIAAKLFEDVVAIVSDDEEAEPNEVHVGVLEESESVESVEKESANAINYDGVEGQPLSDDNVAAEDSVAIEATEVPDDTIAIESGEDLKEELDGQWSKRALMPL